MRGTAFGPYPVTVEFLVVVSPHAKLTPPITQVDPTEDPRKDPDYVCHLAV